MKFKIGNKARIVEADSCGHDHDQKLINSRKVGTIISKSSLNDWDWDINFGHFNCSNCSFKEEQLELVKKGKEVTMKDYKWGIKYERDSDPVEFFKTEKEARIYIKELLDDSGVDKDEIYLFEVGQVFKVERPINFTLLKV